MINDAAALSMRFFGISSAEIPMASFTKVQEMLCLGLIEEIIDEEEFVPLYAAFRSSSLPKGRYKNTYSLIKLNQTIQA